MQSSSAYRSLRTSGFLVLPSERTLNDYIHFYNCSAGCHKDLQDALAAEAQVDKLTDVQKFVALPFDAGKRRPGVQQEYMQRRRIRQSRPG